MISPYISILDLCYSPWWRHRMETFSALLATCAGNSSVTGEFPTQRPVTRSIDVFFDLRLHKRLSKQSWNWWSETTSGRPCNGPLTRYAKLQVAHAPGMPGTFSPAADFKGNRWLAIPACITARAWRTCRDACRDRLPAVTGKTFPAFPAHAHAQICVSGKRPMVIQVWS